MKEKVRVLGLDVHAETIAVAVAEPDGEVRSLGARTSAGSSPPWAANCLGFIRAIGVRTETAAGRAMAA